MKLSTRSEYAVRALVQLAIGFEKGPMSLREISQIENISYQYLEQIFLDLKKTKLVDSIRGAKGGYILARSPDQITVGDIVKSVEGPIAPISCVSDLPSDACERSGDCAPRGVWKALRDRIIEVLDEFTLHDLVSPKEGQDIN